MIVMISFRCRDCRRPWASTLAGVRDVCPFCGSTRIREIDRRTWHRGLAGSAR